MKHLFKLKRDGKTVGYMCIKDGCVSTCSDPWDTAHLFVTQDKNGKDVFEGDRIKAGNWYFTVVWQKYGYGLKGEKSGWWRQFHEFEHIELIEDKKNA